MTTAIYYTSIKMPDNKREVFGLQVAISNWLKAWFCYGTQEKLPFLIGQADEWNEVQKIAADVGLDPGRLIGLDRRYVSENFQEFDTIFRPDTDTLRLFWQRQQVSQGFNFCGLTHAIAGIEAGEILEQYCLAPSEGTDVIVCPSRAAQSAIRSFWESYGDYISQRFGTPFACPVQLPIIPLGIDVRHYENITTPEKRREQRLKLGLRDDDIALLWVGRLSHAIKAHPLAMFQAAERAAERTGAKVHLIMHGYFMPADAEEKFTKLAHDVCRKARVRFVLNDDTRFPDGLWAAGDIFLSLIDNVQESFGLTPLEAMAAGLPRVISDWDGYRDCVENGEDGFLVRTLQPPAGSGRDMAELLLNKREVYGGFLAKCALSVAVDVDMATDAIVRLIQDDSKRRQLIDKARSRARAMYDWPSIIPAYEQLWKEMETKRKANRSSRPTHWPSALPQVPDPYTMYAHYPTCPLIETDRLSICASPAQIKMLWQHDINVFALDIMLPAEDAAKIINHIAAHNGESIATLVVQFPADSHARVWRTIAWLIKLGILRHQSS